MTTKTFIMLFFWSLPNPFPFDELLIIIKIYCQLSYKALCAQSPNHIQPSATPWTVACQAPLSVEFFRQQYWSRLPFSYSSRSSQPRDRTCNSCIFCIGRLILYHWATREAPILHWILAKRPRSESNISCVQKPIMQDCSFLYYYLSLLHICYVRYKYYIIYFFIYFMRAQLYFIHLISLTQFLAPCQHPVIMNV